MKSIVKIRGKREGFHVMLFQQMLSSMCLLRTNSKHDTFSTKQWNVFSLFKNVILTEYFYNSVLED